MPRPVSVAPGVGLPHPVCPSAGGHQVLSTLWLSCTLLPGKPPDFSVDLCVHFSQVNPGVGLRGQAALEERLTPLPPQSGPPGPGGLEGPLRSCGDPGVAREGHQRHGDPVPALDVLNSALEALGGAGARILGVQANPGQTPLPPRARVLCP